MMTMTVRAGVFWEELRSWLELLGKIPDVPSDVMVRNPQTE
jgi:hypothetical protein